MPNYRRVWSPGGTFFFALVTHQRRPIFQGEHARHLLREAFEQGRQRVGPFQVVALCLLPEHLHCIWTLPENEGDYSTRWKVIKGWFSHAYLQQGGSLGELTDSNVIHGEVGVWQRRFWEHTIHDENDLLHHIDYIHYNPVKHGLVRSVKAWPWSTFHRFVREGYYDADWGNETPGIEEILVGE